MIESEFKSEENVWHVSCVDYQQDVFKTFAKSVINGKRDVYLAIDYDEFCFIASENYEDVYYVATVLDWEWENEHTYDDALERLVYIAKQLYDNQFNFELKRFCDNVRTVVNSVRFKRR